MSLGVRLSGCQCVCVRRISLGGEGNALYPVLSSLQYCYGLSLFVREMHRAGIIAYYRG